MAEREDRVYQAKLAEQAERYDGKRIVQQLLKVSFELVLTCLLDSVFILEQCQKLFLHKHKLLLVLINYICGMTLVSVFSR